VLVDNESSSLMPKFVILNILFVFSLCIIFNDSVSDSVSFKPITVATRSKALKYLLPL
jgi:hypothetical protein